MDPATQTTLNRLLTRLDQTVLSGDHDHRLRGSSYERQKAATNVDLARTLLLALEKQSSSNANTRSPAQRQQLQTDLQQKRDLVKRLNTRLQELNQIGDSDSEEDEDEEHMDSEEGNGNGEKRSQAIPSYAPARVDIQDGLDSGRGDSGHPIFSSQQQQAQSQSQSQMQPDLRSRRGPLLQASDNHSATSTTAREALFSGRSQQPTSSSSPLAQKEAVLSDHRIEQENLTTGLLGLAQALKASSQQFSQSLATEKEVLKRAEGGLDKSAQGMEAAERRMGMLRRMSEGQGWWGRVKLYGFIFALWLGCFLLVFVGPKLRL